MKPTFYDHVIDDRRYASQSRPTARCGHIAVNIDRFMLVWGGYWVDKEGDLLNREKYLPGSEIWIFDTDTDTWSVRPLKHGTVPEGRSGATAVLMDKQLHIFGGFNDGSDLNDLYSMDLPSMEWRVHSYTNEEPMNRQPSPRDKHSMWGYNNKLYVFGGFGPPTHPYLQDNGKFLQDNAYSFLGSHVRGWNDQLLIYDLNTSTWSNPAGAGNRPTARAAMACARIEETVYLFGGRHLGARLNDLYSFNCETLTWTRINTLSSIPTGRTWSTLTAISSNLLLLYGGFTQDRTPLHDVWLLDIGTSTWRQLNSLRACIINDARLWHTSVHCAATDDLLIFGGCTNNILNHEEEPEHAQIMLNIRFRPKSLVKLTQEVVMRYRNRLLDDNWTTDLPKSLCENLRTRMKFLVANSDRPGHVLAANANGVCNVS